MKMHRYLASCLVVGGVVLSAVPARAIDVGDPLYKADVNGAVRVEVFYEYYDREAAFDDLNLKLTGPGGTATAGAEVDNSNAEEDLYIARVTAMVGEKGAVYADAGFVDDDGASDLAYMIGVGGRYLAYQIKQVRISAVAALHYVPGFDTESETTTDPTLGTETLTGEISYWEGSAGLLASGNVSMNEKTQFVPYAGLLASTLQGTADVDVSWPDVAVKGSSSTDFEEDSLLVAVVGGSLVLNKQFTLRAEGRLIGDASFSIGLGAAL